MTGVITCAEKLNGEGPEPGLWAPAGTSAADEMNHGKVASWQ